MESDPITAIYPEQELTQKILEGGLRFTIRSVVVFWRRCIRMPSCSDFETWGYVVSRKFHSRLNTKMSWSEIIARI
jgi:hypothetical protein